MHILLTIAACFFWYLIDADEPKTTIPACPPLLVKPGPSAYKNSSQAFLWLNEAYDWCAAQPHQGKDLRARSEIQAALGSAQPAAYNEICPTSFLTLLERAGAVPGHRFYDLGSGAGKTVTLAWLLGMDATGIELATERWRNACSAVERLRAMEGIPELMGQVYGLRHYHMNILDATLYEPDIVFTNSILFTTELLRKVALMVSRLKTGTRVISSGNGLPGSEFKLVGQWVMEVTWAANQIWTIQRIDQGNSSKHTDKGIMTETSIITTGAMPLHHGEVCSFEGMSL